MTPRHELVVATACDRAFADIALNLVGSLQRHDRQADRIAVYDLGMTARQRARLQGIDGVELREVVPFVEHWRTCFTWKPWVWNDAARDTRRVLWLDAGTDVRADLAPIVDGIDRDGYFCVSQREWGPEGNQVLRAEVPSDWFERFGLDPAAASEPVFSSAVFGFMVDGSVHTRVVRRCVELAIAGETIGFSAGDLHRNEGINRLEHPRVMACPMFRHDQSLLNVVMYLDRTPVLHPRALYANPWPRPGDGTVIGQRRRRTSMNSVGSLRYQRFARAKNGANRVRMRVKRSRLFRRSHQRFLAAR